METDDDTTPLPTGSDNFSRLWVGAFAPPSIRILRYVRTTARLVYVSIVMVDETTTSTSCSRAGLIILSHQQYDANSPGWGESSRPDPSSDAYRAAFRQLTRTIADITLDQL